MSSVAGPSGYAEADPSEGSTEPQTLDCAAAFARAASVYRDATAQPGDRALGRALVRKALRECLGRSSPIVIDVGPATLTCRGCPPAKLQPAGDEMPSRLHQAG